MTEKSGVSRRLLIGIVVIGIVICIAAVIYYLQPLGAPEERIAWNVTVVGSRGEERIVTFEEITAMPAHKGIGGFFTTVGMVNGPYTFKGVRLQDLCDLVGGVNASNTVWVSAPDGYLMAFTYDQLKGTFNTYDPATFKEVPHDALTIILTYEQDGAPLSDYDGKPLRLAIVSARGDYLTEGHYWVKWVDRIEVRTPAST